MRTPGAIVRSVSVVAVLGLASPALAQTLPPSVALPATLPTLGVLPRYNQWMLLSPTDRAALQAVAGLPSAQRERLIQSARGTDRGVGIFIADQQGDVAALLSYARLLDDHEPTLPFAPATAVHDPQARSPQTVGEYLTAAYLEWFGVDVDSSARFRAIFANVNDPALLVQPWVVRLRRAAAGEAQAARGTGARPPGGVRGLKERIAALPEPVRWAVVTLGYQGSLYTREEAAALLQQLSSATRDALRAGTDLLPDEPLFRINAGAGRRALQAAAIKLLSEKP